MTVGLVLLGLGWSATTVAGSALLVDAVPAGRRVTVQGLSDASMSGAGALGSLASGAVMGWGGYGALTSVTAVLVVLTAVGAAVALCAPARYQVQG